ncbi:MAG: G5 domain-containing protein [Syntrophomonas sp.]
MTDVKKTIARVISLTTIAIIISLFLVSFALASRDGKMYPSNFSAGGISLANLNDEQAGAQLERIIPAKLGSLLQLKLPDKIIAIPIKECGISPDCDATLENINALLNQDRGAIGLIKHSVIRGQDHDINLIYRADKDLLYKQLVKTQTAYNKPAIDARILYDNGLLEYISHQNGYLINVDATMQNICNALQKGDLGPIEVSATIMYPRVKIDDIKTVKDVIGAYAIPVSSEQGEKGSNLSVASDKLNGVIIMPDETFPVRRNQPANDFYPLTKAVYNAVHQAGLKVTEQPGSTGGNDIYINNSLTTPVLLSAIMKDNKLLVRVFGCQTEAGKEIHLTTEETEVPSQVKVNTDTSLGPGQRKVKQEGKNGFTIRTYRIVTKDGHQLEKNLLAEEVHRGTDTIIVVGPNDPDK